ncbi:hypothetical protein Hanom_Chr15g01374771 [Helianthus anomalus]
MSRTGRSLIRSVLTKEDLESFVATYQIPEQFSLSLHGPDDPAVCTPERIVLYTLAFSLCGVLYPLSPFKVELLKHFGIHFSQLHPLAFMMVVHFELSCVAVSSESSVPLFCMFYKLLSDGEWFTFAKRKILFPHFMTLWGLLQADCRGIKFMVGDAVNPEMGNVLGGKLLERGVLFMSGL